MIISVGYAMYIILGDSMYKFKNIENLILFIKYNPEYLKIFRNSLFEYNDNFILEVYVNIQKSVLFSKFNMRMSEYGEKMRNYCFSGLYAEEHFKPVIKDTAMETLYSVFCKFG